jgi:hypothetical protein
MPCVSWKSLPASARTEYEREPEKNQAAAALGRKGGAARAESMSADNRKKAAQKAAKVRWSRKKSLVD